jgi:hypothetical protein
VRSVSTNTNTLVLIKRNWCNRTAALGQDTVSCQVKHILNRSCGEPRKVDMRQGDNSAGLAGSLEIRDGHQKRIFDGSRNDAAGPGRREMGPLKNFDAVVSTPRSGR